MGDVVDLERFRGRRDAAPRPIRVPRPYRYDPGPLAGKTCDRPPAESRESDDGHRPDPPRRRPR